MINFNVSKSKEEALLQKMARFGIKESDLIENFVRSGGPGGQNVNKTSTAVYLKHIPTGIEVKCQETRSQVLNRYLARKILVNKIEDKILGKLSEEKQKIYKLKKQKKRRSRRAKQKMLEDKHRQSKKKEFRSRVNFT